MEHSGRHILFLCSWYPNPEDKSNGIFIRHHAKALSLRHHVTVVFAKSVDGIREPMCVHQQEGQLNERLYFYPKSGHRLPGISQLHKFLAFKQAYRQLIDALAPEPFDIIHVNTVFPAAIPARYAMKKYPGASLFITEHWSGYYPEDGNYRGTLTTYYTRLLVDKARAVLVISDKLADAMKQHGLRNKYHLIHNSIDTDVFTPTDLSSQHEDRLRILHVSSLTEREKNISGIITVAAHLKSMGKAFQLSLVGSNRLEEDSHRNLVAQHGLEQEIIFCGYQSQEAIARYMNQADVLFMFSHFEGAPVVITEALSCGLPVISTDVGQIRQMIPEGMGLVLSNADPEACAEVLRRFCRSDFPDKPAMHRYIAGIYSHQAVCEEISHYYNRYS